MIITEKKIDCAIPTWIKENDKKIAYFDIETTGFISESTHIYSLGISYIEDNNLTYKQWFIEDVTEEKNVLMDFFSYIIDYEDLVTFNGTTFDIPFIDKKCIKYGLDNPLKAMTNWDIYKTIYRHKNIISLKSFRQANIEQAIGINRLDQYNGKELIKIYHIYQSMSKINSAEAKLETDKLYKMLFLHNYEDVINMIKISNIFNLSYIFESSSISYYLENDKLIIEIKALEDTNLEIVHYISNYINLFNNQAFEILFDVDLSIIKFVFYIEKKELKHYFPDTKNYYYLPLEDCVIHKSIGSYVDANYRCNATKEKCYIRKTDEFVKIGNINKPCICSEYGFVDFKEIIDGETYIVKNEIENKKEKFILFIKYLIISNYL